MGTQHTPGPWLIFPKEAKLLVYCDDEMGSLIANCESRYTILPIAEREANAKLIAAAPEMYEAMKTFCDRVEKGEVRSKKTYATFKDILNKVEQ